MGNGTDVAIDSADVVLVGGDLRASRCGGRSQPGNGAQYPSESVLGVYLQSAVHPDRGGRSVCGRRGARAMYGALAMSLSSVFVVTNALRLMRFRPKGMRGKAAPACKAQGCAIEQSKIKGGNGMQKILKIEGMSCSLAVRA